MTVSPLRGSAYPLAPLVSVSPYQLPSPPPPLLPLPPPPGPRPPAPPFQLPSPSAPLLLCFLPASKPPSPLARAPRREVELFNFSNFSRNVPSDSRGHRGRREDGWRVRADESGGDHRALPEERQRVRDVEAPEVTSGGTEARPSRSPSPDWAP